MLTALVVSLAIGGGLVSCGFAIGRAYERIGREVDAVVYVLPRHAAHHHRPALRRRTVHTGSHLRVVTPIYDWSEEDSPA